MRARWLAAGELMPLAAAVEGLGEGPGQLPGVGGEACMAGLLDSGEQRGLFGGEPGLRGLLVGSLLEDHPGLRRCQGDRVLPRVWVQQDGGAVSSVQVVVE
jgi:hypothetical protein